MLVWFVASDVRPRVCGVACPDEGDAWHAAAAQSHAVTHESDAGLVVIMAAASPISFSDPPVSERAAAVTITEQVLFR